MKDERSREEADLVRRCAAGEEDAWAEFVDRYLSLLTALASRMLARRTGRVKDADVDETVAEVFLSLLRRDRILLRRYDSQWRLSTYLGVICRTAVSRLLRRRREAPLDRPDALPERSVPPEGLQALTREEREEALGCLREGLASIPERDRLLLELRFLEGLDYQAIAVAVGVGTESVGPLLSRAKRRLAKHIPNLEGLLRDDA